MTVILGFAIDDYPVLVGDLLISSMEDGKSLNIPTIGNRENLFPKGSGYVPTGLRQKINIIGENLAVGWSGSLLAARETIKELKKRNDKRKQTYRDIKDFLENLGPWVGGHDVSFIVLGIDSGSPFFLCRNVAKLVHPYLGSIWASGSGGDVLSSLSQFNTPNIISDTPNPLQKVITIALALSGCLMQHELKTGVPIFHYFGGGYEIASVVAGKIKKVNDVTFVFWDAQNTNKGINLSFPTKIMKFDYYRNDLIIRTVDFDFDKLTKNSAHVEDSGVNNIGRGKSINESIYLISPVYRELIARSDPKLIPKFNSSFFCHQAFFTDSQGKLAVACIVDYSLKEPTEFKIIEEQGQLKIQMGKTLVERLARLVHSNR